MSEKTHTVTTIEAVNLAEEAKKYLAMKNDLEASVVTIVMNKSTAEYLHGLIDKDFDDNLTDFDELILITNYSKDLGFNEQVAGFIDWIKESYPVKYQEYLQSNKSDHSGASDQENR